MSEPSDGAPAADVPADAECAYGRWGEPHPLTDPVVLTEVPEPLYGCRDCIP